MKLCIWTFRFTPTDAVKIVIWCLIRRLLFKTSFAVSLNKYWTNTEQRYFSWHLFLPGFLKCRVEQFYSRYLLGLLTTCDNERTSRLEILHQKIKHFLGYLVWWRSQLIIPDYLWGVKLFKKVNESNDRTFNWRSGQ